MAQPDFDLALGHQLYIQMRRATTSARFDAASMRHWRAEAERLPPGDTSCYALMARGNGMSHRDFPVANCAAQPHDQAGERWQRTVTVNGHRVPTTDQMFWSGISCFYLLPATAAPLGFTPDGLPIGVQIVGAQFDDRTTIGLARLLETAWQGFVPPPGWE